MNEPNRPGQQRRRVLPNEKTILTMHAGERAKLMFHQLNAQISAGMHPNKKPVSDEEIEIYARQAMEKQSIEIDSQNETIALEEKYAKIRRDTVDRHAKELEELKKKTAMSDPLQPGEQPV